jgi:DNA-binding response OmpR family regulator
VNETIKILIVEDETIVALDIKGVVKKLGYDVTNCVTNYDDAIKSVIEDEPDIILMDINLKNSLDGIQTVQDIKKIKNIPIIYLTAFYDDETIQRAIETNPVGYLIKPFKKAELKSTILLAIYKIEKSIKLTIDSSCEPIGLDYYFNRDEKLLYYKNNPIRLSDKESLLLSILVEAKGTIVPFENLEFSVWQAETVSPSSLRTLLYRLRGKLEYKLIETIPKVGCKLVTKW